MAGVEARGDRIGDGKPADATRQSVLPPAFTKKVSVRQKGASLAVSELYGWQWHEVPDGVIVIDRPTARIPQSLPEVYRDIHKSLSPQLLRYLGCTEGSSLPSRSEGDLARRFPIVESPSDQRAAHIWPSLPDPLRQKKELPVAKLSDTQLEQLLESLVGQAFRASYPCLNKMSAQIVPHYVTHPLSVTASYDYTQDGRIGSFLIASRWTDITGSKRYMTGVGCGADSLHNHRSAEAMRKEYESIGQ
jgi:hypothetical protein